VVLEWKDKLLDYEKSKVALLLESAECNISHGDRLSPGDKKRIVREIATSDPECKWTESALAKKLGVIQQRDLRNWKWPITKKPDLIFFIADPHDRWCGKGERKTPPYPISPRTQNNSIATFAIHR
jgi:hypothetical protein